MVFEFQSESAHTSLDYPQCTLHKNVSPNGKVQGRTVSTNLIIYPEIPVILILGTVLKSAVDFCVIEYWPYQKNSRMLPFSKYY